MQNKNNRTVWVIDPIHTKIRFEVKYLMLTAISGWFTEFEGFVISANSFFSPAQVQLTIYANSLYTANEERDMHLRSSSFFGTAQHPTISFESASLLSTNTTLQLSGSLRIKETSRKVTTPVVFNGTALDPAGNTKAGFEFNTSINRQDFNLGWSNYSDANGGLISDEVKIWCNIQLLQLP